ncbi:M15 family metallopeptidase [Duganella violaceipulchra]|uniref:D-alanyl-D-alanine dipeptidase n=1 Tax=Duganella violaceipulchra TaxID=2849652 RepID=A0AA41H9M6_9BURK|nr:M15 family metallopeptidase [Duganella violaceicalia]MBV6320822.1 M15 family metallopeptidase [Duganella violaceicalia]MCP2008467.1 D-alanyl-D-alanine dipeptidase [Duganella violaceicalia]
MAFTITCEEIAGHPDFRRLASIDGIAVELRYATPDNFVGRDLYSPLDCGWLHNHAAAALEKVVAWLAARRPDCKVLVLDALRPQRVQEQLWLALQGTELLGYIADPARGSIHSFGMALDLTLLDAQGRELDMGTGFDDLSERSHPALEAKLLARGELTAPQIANRQLLRDAMFQAGWVGISSEWWHFDCGDRLLVRRDHIRVL